jgi:imidazolonepropionase-like amidohydrolase
MSLRVLLALSLCLALARGASAQARRGEAYALTGARVVTVSGPVHESGTLVMRDGLIEAVGPSVAVPPGARVIDAKGLTLTPGLIDGLCALGLPAPPPRGAAPAPGGAPLSPPPNPLAPQALAYEKLKAADALKARDAGLTTALVIPREGVLPGQSVLINLAGDKPEAMVLRQPAALHLHLGELPRRYPNSLMGTVALARQALHDAKRYGEEWAEYEKAPAGKKRPRYDPGLEAWREVVAGREPLVVTASRANDIRRALLLADEFRVKVVVAGAPQAARLAPLVKERKLPLLVSVNFDPPRAVPLFGGADEEQERRDIEEAERNPAELHRLGVPFALVSAWAPSFAAGIRKAIEKGLPRDVALAAVTLRAAEALGVADRLGSLEAGKIANVVAWSGEPLTKDAKAKMVFVDGSLYEPEERAEPKKEDAKKSEETTPEAPRAAAVPAPPEPPMADERPLALVGGTLLTLGPQGTIEKGTVLLRGGRIAAVGRDLSVPAGSTVIALDGRYVMPGIIDTHSHTAIEGNVNECTDSATAEVRVADVVDDQDIDIYRQLAGGVTTINVLHGSCNTIGGQNAVLKMRWGQPPHRLLFEGAPRGIKLALGENPKRSNFRVPGEPRYPATRMGVEVVLREAFAAARDYKREWEDYESRLEALGPRAPRPAPPRRDLRLETLRDVLEGKVLVHAHCYRSDEILMLLRLSDEFGFKVRTLQHGLEAYKVAGEIARHGAGVGTFIDWWGFKLEAFDATPYNPAILQRHGVLVSLNSDSAELARRLYWDAAKAVKHGGVEETEALKMVTLNAAIQLGIDRRVGTIEAGKDADLAIFRTHPFAPDTLCEMTLVDGIVYFDRKRDLASRQGSTIAESGR